MSERVEKVMEELKAMTLLEASELVKAIEETFGVSAAAPTGGMVMPMPGMMPGAPVGEAAAEPVEEQTEFDVVLEEVPSDKKIAILKVVREITGLGLKDAKEMVEAAPKAVKEATSKEDAEEIKGKLEGAGAKASVK